MRAAYAYGLAVAIPWGIYGLWHLARRLDPEGW